MMKMKLNRKGEETNIDTVVFILVAVIFIAFILNLFSIISAKQQLDVCADQLTRQIQLAGEVNSTTDSLFQSLCGHGKCQRYCLHGRYYLPQRK